MTADERLDQTIMESFPASDPPSYWAGEATQRAGGTMKGTMGTTNVYPGQAAETPRHSNDVHLLVSSD